MTDSLWTLPSPDVAESLRRNPLVVLPFGSIEQHGAHLPCGTDTLIAERLAEAVAGKLDALYAPFGPYGVTPIHAGRPGTVSLSPETFERLLEEILLELIRMGAKTLVLCNWHEMNTPSLNGVAAKVQAEQAATVVVAQACYTAQRIYRDEGGELTHGGSIETLGVLAEDPALVRSDRIEAVSRPPHAAALDEMRRGTEVYGFVTDVGEFGGEGWYGDPDWATEERATTFVERVSAEVAAQVEHVLSLRKAATTDVKESK
ncbi:MAG TPA: creatininase family protein [Gaiellaceae bacterium]|nr:creatininase family protein [Gaiellaceae bacterium]